MLISRAFSCRRFEMMYTSYALLALTSTVSAAPPAILRRAVNPALVPDFGVTRGIPTAQAGTCQGLNGATIPCFCPPDRQPFIDRLNQYVDAGNAFGIPVSFPEGNDGASITAQNNALVVTLQNFNNTAKGVGCPQGAAVFKQGSARSGDSGEGGSVAGGSGTAPAPNSVHSSAPVANSSAAAPMAPTGKTALAPSDAPTGNRGHRSGKGH